MSRLRMLPICTIVVALCSTAAPTAFAQGNDRVEIKLKQVQEAAQAKVDAARTDYALVGDALGAMHRALRAGGPNVIPEVNVGLQHLRLKHRDSRLDYRGEEDRCRVLDALREIQRAALRRQVDALAVKTGALRQEELYHSVRAELSYADLRGEPLKKANIEKVFLRALHTEETIAGLEEVEDSMAVPGIGPAPIPSEHDQGC